MVTRKIGDVLKTNTILTYASTATNYLTPSSLTTNNPPSSSPPAPFPYPTITILVLSSLLLFSIFMSLLKKCIKIMRARRYNGFRELEQLLERRIMIRYLETIDDPSIHSSSSQEPYSDNTHSRHPSQQEQNEHLEAVDNHGGTAGGNCPRVTRTNASAHRNGNNGQLSLDSDDELWLLVDYQMEAGIGWTENRVSLDEVEIARMYASEIEGEGGSPGDFWR